MLLIATENAVLSSPESWRQHALADETGDGEIRRLYRVADSLHINFYEDVDTAADVEAGLEDVRRLLEKLQPFVAVQDGGSYAG